MPFTELVVLSLQQTEEARSAFYSPIKPALSSIIKDTPAAKDQFFGRIISENGNNVEKAVKFAIGIEWENPDDLQKVLDSDRFKTFGATVVKPYAAGPATPQLYETNTSPVSAFSLPLTEVFRVEIPGTEEMKRAKETWELFETVLKGNSGDVQVLSGLSTNLEEKLFLGAIGWKASEARENALKSPDVEKAKLSFESLGGVSSLAVEFVAEK